MHERPDDERLTRLLQAVHADADPVLWTRVRARIEAREAGAARGWLGWAMRPAALGLSFAMLGLALATSAALVATTPTPRTSVSADDLPDALVAELVESATPAGTASGPASDSGSVR